MKYHFTYKTTNLINQKIYIGVHSTNNLEDGYIGSGIFNQIDTKHFKQIGFIGAVTKYGYGNFKREILEHFETSKAAFESEKEIVTTEFCNRKDTYNIALGGRGGNLFITLTEEQKENRRLQVSNQFKTWWLKLSGEERVIHSFKIGGSQKGRIGTNLGKKFSKRHKENISLANKGKTTRSGYNLSNSHKEKISKSNRKYKIQTPDGIFDTLTEVGTYYNLNPSTICYRLKNKNFIKRGWKKIE